LTKPRNQRLELAPQMADYDGLGVNWHPYIMYFHSPNFRSVSVNTDSFGFRTTETVDGPISPCGDLKGRDVSVVVGGSTAFGVGAETDAGTIASHLSRHTGHAWLNMSGRAFSAFQEFALFSQFQSDLPRMKSVVIVSGFNNLFLALRNLPFEMPLGSFFYQKDYNIAMSGQVAGRREQLRRLLRKDDFKVDMVSRTVDDAIALALETTRRTLLLWSALAKYRNFSLTFALQPNSMWSRRVPSSHESLLFSSLETIDPSLDSLLRRLTHDCYVRYSDSLSRMANDEGIRFVDLNPPMHLIAESPETLHVDRVHYTSLGYRHIAAALLT
jgi:hypothetical protein